jgi:putative nucleotidyltransferase with HDIG domain
MHMAAGLLFGAFWAAILVGVSVSVGEVASRRAPLKLVFNASQRILSIVVAVVAYQRLGGTIVPAYLAGAHPATASSRLDLALFPVFAAAYFFINSAAVAAVVSINTGRNFREVWALNTRGSLGYDIAASGIAILAAFLFEWSAESFGFGPLGLLGVILPLIVVRHVYGLYHKLQDSGRELLEVMVKAIEARDPYTSGHSVRVATLSRAIAQELHLPVDVIDRIYTAALLHDVGKIHEEFAPLLRKEARLTAEEEVVLQQHPIKSAELVGIISAFRGTVHDAVRSHHERWDGAGYPDRLAGDAIPLGARIITIADTADAMTTDRPYRSAASGEEALGEIRRCRGTQFDPRIADAALASPVFIALVCAPHASVQRLSIDGAQDSAVSVPRASGWRWLVPKGTSAQV